jgi:hypothetical protein
MTSSLGQPEPNIALKKSVQMIRPQFANTVRGRRVIGIKSPDRWLQHTLMASIFYLHNWERP